MTLHLLPQAHTKGVLQLITHLDMSEVACGRVHYLHAREQFVTFLTKRELGIISKWQVHR